MTDVINTVCVDGSDAEMAVPFPDVSVMCVNRHPMITTLALLIVMRGAERVN